MIKRIKNLYDDKFLPIDIKHKLISKVQQTITPTWQYFAGGCSLDRNISELIEQAGFTITGTHGFTNGSSIVGYHYWGEVVVL